ncbi:hypothetical protein HFP57_01240 [Parasphingopyxis algicola]|uniref:hypothetical protein n=1 Tax=Parasphingopyxis algicola TaxID=2026624 RepID=UPI0015A1E8E6|nr:hypothetical protein [Parasphingopyxis algicola]QLC23791.1 hypothetical protein HFP57_01240 [Parasphingopyxis algicola]
MTVVMRISGASWIVLAGALALAACGESQLGETEVTTNGMTDEAAEDSPQLLTPVDTPPPVELPVLAPISYAVIEAELEAGAGCSVVEDGKALLVAVEGDAIAQPNGTMRHFAFDGEPDALWDGGTFTAGVFSIEVTPGEGEGEQIEGVLVKPASVLVREEGQEGETEIRAEWHCGA